MGAGVWQGGSMSSAARGDVWKVWLYATVSVALGAGIAPLLYGAGKALAEVESGKVLNEPLQVLAAYCRGTDLPGFFKVGVLLVAGLLFFPWLEWIHAVHGLAWRDDPPCGRGRIGRWWGPLQCAAGFLLVTGLVLAPGMVWALNGDFKLRHAAGGPLILHMLEWALLAAVVMEVFFRGIVLGAFRRAMRPAVALAMSAVFFALVFSVFQTVGLKVADPETAGAGCSLLVALAKRLSDGHYLCVEMLPLLVLGVVLAHARLRAGALWLPIGLQWGWLFSFFMLARLCMASIPPDAGHASLTILPHAQEWLPLAAILITGVMVHCLTSNPETPDAGSS